MGLRLFYFVLIVISQVEAAPPQSIGQPIKGEVLDSSENLDAVCLVTVSKPDGTQAYCSGTLVAKQFVLTSAHCIKILQTPQSHNSVACGYSGFTENAGVRMPNFKYVARDVKSFFGDEKGMELLGKSDPQSLYYDVGMLCLEPPNEVIQPMKTPINPLSIEESFHTSIDHYFMQQKGILKLKPEMQCRIAGFGASSEIKSPGFLHTADLEKVFSLNHATISALDDDNGAINISPKDVVFTDRLEKEHSTITRESLGRIQSASLPSTLSTGDGGGPLYCRQGGIGPWILLGVSKGLVTTTIEVPAVNGQKEKISFQAMSFHYVGSRRSYVLISASQAAQAELDQKSKLKQAPKLKKNLDSRSSAKKKKKEKQEEVAPGVK